MFRSLSLQDGHLLAPEDIQLPENFRALERSLNSINEVIKTLSDEYAVRFVYVAVQFVRVAYVYERGGSWFLRDFMD